LIRINKFLSLCGVTSRRGADAMIAEGRVTINDTTIAKPGVVVDPDKDVVKVDGTAVAPVTEKVYVVLNKPRDVMTTLYDPFKRTTVVKYLQSLGHRVYPVGRLDYDTQGVLILTNDGDLAYRLAHPRFEIKKIYEARVIGHFSAEAGEAIRKGVKLEDGHIGHATVDILQYGDHWSRIRVTMIEGHKREVKQLCKHVGYPVLRLTRVDFAGLTAKGLGLGKWRHLTKHEVERLTAMVGL
jgi:pseudouridine synthase